MEVCWVSSRTWRPGIVAVSLDPQRHQEPDPTDDGRLHFYGRISDDLRLVAVACFVCCTDGDCVLHANELLRDYGHSAAKQSDKGDAGQGVGPSIRVGWFLECAGIANLVHHWSASQDILRRYWRLGFLDGHCSPGRANNCRLRVRNCGRRRIDHVEGRVRNIQVAARHRI